MEKMGNNEAIVERFRLKKYENEARLVFSSMKIGKDDIRLKWKKWEIMKRFHVCSWYSW